LERGFRLVDNQREACAVGHRDFGKNFAIELDAGEFQAVHEFAVWNSGFAAGRANPHDPQSAKIPLLAFASGVGELERALNGFLSRAMEFTFGKKETGCAF